MLHRYSKGWNSSPKDMSEIPMKPHRKKIDVPVHRTEIILNDNKKTYGANFHSKRYKQKEEKSLKTQNSISATDPISQKVSRKYLSKENVRLMKENEEIIIKFNELEELSLKKILKLKEKTTTLQDINATVCQENNKLKTQLQEVFMAMEDLKKELELSKHCQDCYELKKNIRQLEEENSLIKDLRNALDNDIKMMKMVIYRLNVQLERYQDKLRSFNLTEPQVIDNIAVLESYDPNTLEEHQGHTHTPISWGRVNAHTLGPLLDAYQDTINEKDDIIQNYETEMSNFSKKLKEIVKENELLQQHLTEDLQCSSKLKIVVAALRQELKTVKEQNDILIKKCALKQDKVDEILKSYEHKVEQLKRDYGVVHEQYCKSRTEVAALKEKNKALVDAQEEFKTERHNFIPLPVHTSSVNECKKWYEELKFQYEQEKSKLKKHVESQNKLIHNFENTVSQHVREKEELNLKLRQLERQIKNKESKYLELEHTLHEVQVARSACKKQLNKAMNFAKDLVAEQETLLKALSQKQQENKVVKKIGFDIATRMDDLRNQLKDVQRDAWQELTSVEKKINDQDELLESIKQEHSGEIERLQQIIKAQKSNLLLNEQEALPQPPYVLFKDKHS